MLFQQLTAELQDEPTWNTFRHRDDNPVSGRLKFRVISSPNSAMREVHSRILRLLRKVHFYLPYATACQPGNSPRLTIGRHINNRFFYLTDLHNAYSSVDGEALARVLVEVGFGASLDETPSFEEVLEVLQHFCIKEEGGLITGAPTSPDLFNIYAGKLLDEERLKMWVEQYALTYTRYLDDLVFSSKHPIGERKRKALRQAVIDAGFKINHRKSEVRDIWKGPVIINGIGLSKGRKIFLPRHYVRRIRGAMHRQDVTPPQIAGMMGSFFSSTRTLGMNNTEEKLVHEFRNFQNKAR